MTNAYCINIFSFVTAITSGANLVGCASMAGKDLSTHPETVLGCDLSILAENAHGKVRIHYISRSRRQIEFDGKLIEINLVERDYRYMGSYGIYNPTGSLLPFVSRRWSVQEGLINFFEAAEVREFIDSLSSKYDWQFTDDGLMIGFFSEDEPPYYVINIYQLFVDGEKANTSDLARGLVATFFREDEVDSSDVVYPDARRLPYWNISKFDVSDTLGSTGIHGHYDKK